MIQIERFDEAGLREELLKSITEMGFEKPSEIQSYTLPYLLNNETDLIALAQTGTGKTAAFGLPVLNVIEESNKKTQALILSPTRELCLQISRDIENYGKHIKGLRVEAVYGGTSIDNQIRNIKKGAQVVVGTPGRTLDLLKRKVLKIEHIDFVVFDEADEMLSMGFQDDLDAILAYTKEDKQTLFFSATMPREAQRMTKKYMNEPQTIQVGSKNEAAANVTHYYCQVSERDRFNALKRIMDVNPEVYGIIFCRTKRETQNVANKLMADGYNIDALHGDLSQAQRDKVMENFKKGLLQLIVATDVAARGLDVSKLNLVLNYNLPDDPEVYVHRSGRTGRAGNKGDSICLINFREKGKLRQIEKLAQNVFKEFPIPEVNDICQAQINHWANKLENTQVDTKLMSQFATPIVEKLEQLEKHELVEKLITLEFSQLLNYYKNAKSINQDASSERGGRDRGRDRDRGRGRDRDRGRGRDRERGGRDRDRGARGGNGSFDRFHINIGRKARLKPTDIIDIVNTSFPNQSLDIGDIKIMDSFSFFELDKKYSREALDKMQRINFKGKTLSVEKAKARTERF